MSQYRIQVYNTSAVLQQVLVSWNNLRIEHTLNSFSTHTLSLPDYSTDEVWDSVFETDSIVEVWRRDQEAEIDWYLEYAGFHRTPQHQTTETNRRLYTSYGRGFLDFAQRRKVLYRAGHARSKPSGPGETVLKNYVDWNCGPNALTSGGRVRDGAFTGLTVPASGGDGGTWEGQRAWNNVLDVLVEVGKETGVDFDIVRTTGANFEFRTYWPQKGTDRTVTNGSVPPVVFSTVFANMIDPSYTYSRTEEKNVIIVLGQGEELFRVARIRTQPNTIDDSPWNDHEETSDARQETLASSLDKLGDQRLKELAGQESLSFRVVQQGPFRYGRDYFVGDKVTARYGAIERDLKITSATLSIGESGEDINIGMELVV